MVRRQLCTLDDLMDSGFGRPFPRHGLQLLFWFANHCVTFEPFIKLVSECQPENGSFGFHHFNNNEKLLPVLYKTRRLKPESQVVYSEVGNLNTNAFPAAASLPAYVTENYEIAGNNGNKNTDRIIISFHMQTRIVETVHVTKHDEGFSGKFSPHETYKVSCELIQALQNPELDITTFLNHMGYYTDIQGQQLYNVMVPIPTNYSHQQVQYYSRHDIWRSLASGRSNWRQLFKDLDGRAEPRNYASGGIGGGGDSIFKVLLTAGALYLTAKCFSWLWNCWTGGSDENIIKMVGWSTPRYQPSHVMLDYVY